jgi:hypothetical protein
MTTKRISVHHTDSGPRRGTDHQWHVGENDGHGDPMDFSTIYMGRDFSLVRDIFAREVGRSLTREEERLLERQPGDCGGYVIADCR